EREEAGEIAAAEQPSCGPGNADQGRWVFCGTLFRSGGFREEPPDRGGFEQLAESLEAEPCSSSHLTAADPDRSYRVGSMRHGLRADAQISEVIPGRIRGVVVAHLHLQRDERPGAPDDDGDLLAPGAVKDPGSVLPFVDRDAVDADEHITLLDPRGFCR